MKREQNKDEERSARPSGRQNLYTERRRERIEHGEEAKRAPRRRGYDARETERPGKEEAVRTYKEEKEYYQKSLKERRYTSETAFAKKEREPDHEPEPLENEDYESEYSESDDYEDEDFESNGYEDYEDYEDEDFESEDKNRNRKKQKKKSGAKKAKRIGTAIVCVLLVLVILLGIVLAVPSLRNPALKVILKTPLGPIAGQLVFGGSFEKYVRDKDFKSSDVKKNNGVRIPVGNNSVALFGVDARAEELESGTKSDSIMVVNVDGSGQMKMASVFRDTYLMCRAKDSEIITKANAAYAHGGPMGAVNMLNENFDLALTDYIVVNFWGLANIVDELGGIRLTVTEEEREALNYHMLEQNLYGNTEYRPLEESGANVLLTGDQATAFCRLRKVTFYSPADGITYRDDYGRAARQRYVLTELLAQIRSQGMLKMMQMSNKLFEANSGEDKFIQTSMSVGELVRFFADCADMNISGSEGFPDLQHQYTAMLDSGDCVVADTLEETVTLMHAFLYGTENYEPTEDLKNLAERIRAEVFRQIGR